MKRYGIIAHLVCTSILVGCVPASVTSFRDSNFTGKSFEKISVLSTIRDSDERLLLEKAVSSRLINYSVTGIPVSRVFLGTYVSGIDEMTEILTKNGIDGVLVLELIGKERRVETSFDLSLDVFENKWQTASNIDYQPTIPFVISLYDVSNSKLVWTTLTSAAGNGYDGAHNWADSVADATIKELRENRVLETE